MLRLCENDKIRVYETEKERDYMENVVVRERKVVLRVGGVCTLVFWNHVSGSAFSAISDDSGGAAFVALSDFYPAFCVPGIICVLSYLEGVWNFLIKSLQCILSSESKKVYPYTEIRRLLFIERAGETRIAVLGKEGERLASFEMNMSGAEEALYFWKRKASRFLRRILWGKNPVIKRRERL